MSVKAMLIDVTKCIGCRSCQVSCKSWNDLESEQTELNINNTLTNPAQMSDKTYTIVNFVETEKDGKPVWRFAKKMCMHCTDPACASACFSKAITKRESGAVVYEADNCVGCRYCMLACPWWIPKYEWKEVFPKIQKCRFCIDLLENGKEPACAATCPSAITFGDRDEMLSIAKKRLADNPGKYVNHIYGEHEVGGTNVLYLSDVPFEELGLPTLSAKALPPLTWKSLTKVPYLAGGVGVTMTALYMLTNRKNEVAKVEKEGKVVNNNGQDN